jgi:hypothetical protein
MKEGCLHAFVLERGQHAVGGAGRGPVVEGEHHLLRLKRQRLRKLLASDRRGLRRIDRQHACGAERRRLPGQSAAAAGDAISASKLRQEIASCRPRGQP